MALKDKQYPGISRLLKPLSPSMQPKTNSKTLLSRERPANHNFETIDRSIMGTSTGPLLTRRNTTPSLSNFKLKVDSICGPGINVWVNNNYFQT